jgi:hypothetical protein
MHLKLEQTSRNELSSTQKKNWIFLTFFELFVNFFLTGCKWAWAPNRWRAPGRTWLPVRSSSFSFLIYMGPKLFHDRWVPRCVVCSILIYGAKFVPLQVDPRCVVCSLFVIIKENTRVFFLQKYHGATGKVRKSMRESGHRARGK